MRHILAIDEGTTGVTCLMIGEDGRVTDRADAKRLMAGWQRAVGAAVAWARDDRQVD